MPLKKLFIAIFLMFSLLTPAQATHSVRYPTFKVDGTMKNKFEYASETGSYRFSVRNSRMGEVYAVPVSIEFGAYNGNTINTSVWRKKLSCGECLEFGSMKGLWPTFKFYNYLNTPTVHYFFYGADLRYEGTNWKAETEFMKRDNKEFDEDQMLSNYPQGAYAFPLKKTYFFKHIIMPAF